MIIVNGLKVEWHQGMTDKELIGILIQDPRFNPDILALNPTVVVNGVILPDSEKENHRIKDHSTIKVIPRVIGG